MLALEGTNLGVVIVSELLPHFAVCAIPNQVTLEGCELGAADQNKGEIQP